MKQVLLLLTLLCACTVCRAEDEVTFAEKLGWPKGAKVVVIHVDDVGMSHSSNLGAIKTMTEGVASSCAIMMPCSWVSEYAHYLQKNPGADAGLHLTMTSEWRDYRWGPVAGKGAVPGMVDAEGCMWPSVLAVNVNASADEVEKEILAQLDRAVTMGIEPTHLDSHMGTLFSPKFVDRYIKVGIDKHIPVLFPGGHLQYIGGSAPVTPEYIRAKAKQLWDAGLPVVDDIMNDSYGWKPEEKVDNYIKVFKEMKPGVTYVICHASDPTCEFEKITDSGPSRKGDMDALTDPRVKQALVDEKVIVTTMRELKERREKVGK
mgnify:CR=1 FL=1